MREQKKPEREKRILFPPAVAEICLSISNKGFTADKAIEWYFKEHFIKKQEDKGIIAEWVYFCLRHRRLLYYLFGKEDPSLFTKHKLLMGYCSLITGDKKHAPNYLHISELREAERLLEEGSKDFSVRESYPVEINDYCLHHLGKEVWEKTAKSLNRKPTLFIRVNTLKCSIDELKYILKEEGISSRKIKWSPLALELDQSESLYASEAFKKGLFEIQDAVSQLICNHLPLQPGWRVIDTCAGAGGKSLQMAALMKNKGRLLALDTNAKRLQQLQLRTKRSGISIIEIKLIDSTKVIKRLHESADAILIDAPCSGTGVWRRNPDAKWKVSIEMIERLKEEQAAILESYHKLCKPEGFLLYSTCSILPVEGEEQIKNFLNKHPNWELVEEKRYHPFEFDGDGFYVSLLKRKKNENSSLSKGAL